MPTSILFVTVRGPLKTLDLELPGDVPVGELIPLLLEMCGSQRNVSQKGFGVPMKLQVVGARMPLSADITLSGADVCDGAVLVLETSMRVESPAPQHFAPKAVRPTAETGGIGITWEGLE
jgi:hypothetical protein